MPFIVIFSFPAALLFWVVGSLVLFFKARAVKRRASDSAPAGEKVPLTAFVRYAWWHFAISAAIALIAGAVLMTLAVQMIYSMKVKYVFGAFVFAICPLLSWLATTGLMLYLIYRRGPRPLLLVGAGVLHAALVTGCFFLGLVFC
jgi:hypothetical protein